MPADNVDACYYSATKDYGLASYKVGADSKVECIDNATAKTNCLHYGATELTEEDKSKWSCA